ncbi:MAG: methyl-accepting chemotaxis protein, partial [Oscillospiraceae bacterium]|nr:methyl-accepting chemotaxis protein [Oscillospiraceae bacterium]
SDVLDMPTVFISANVQQTAMILSADNVSREEFVKQMVSLAINADFLDGFWFMFEADKFDDNAAAYIGSDYGILPDGRLFQGFVAQEGNGNVTFIPMSEAEIAETYSEDYYTEAMRTGELAIISPYRDIIDGVAIDMVTVCAPIITQNGDRVGVLGADISLDFIHGYLQAQEVFDTGYIVLTDEEGTVIYSPDEAHWMKNKSSVGLDYSSSPSQGVYETVKSVISGKDSMVLTSPIRFSYNDSVYYLSISAPLSEINAQSNRILAILVIGALISIILVSVVIYFSIARMLLPIVETAKFFNQAATTGEITCSPEVNSMFNRFKESGDEIGQLITDCDRFMDHMIRVSEEMERIAGGDLTIDVVTLSGRDTIGVSLAKMVENLSSMFSEINRSTAQVSSGSRQISEGAQTLARGATEQSASIDELSVSIAEIANRIKENAIMAEDAAKFIGTIKENAESGSRQMDAMISAVNEINNASNSISKVIKVIDDIAFQTNILALNAAVEAARAGQHGKGFAVVAEEVRNLAAKSAEAAKDTGSLIANSIEKAELGARIADETAASLDEIVAGINESSRIVLDIAKSSEEQTAGITQINKGIDQVAQVIQQNSATAEESAAASEQMSGQANMLEELISRFKLKDGARPAARLHAAPQRQLVMPEKTTYAPPMADGGDFGKY